MTHMEETIGFRRKASHNSILYATAGQIVIDDIDDKVATCFFCIIRFFHQVVRQNFLRPQYKVLYMANQPLDSPSQGPANLVGLEPVSYGKKIVALCPISLSVILDI